MLSCLNRHWWVLATHAHARCKVPAQTTQVGVGVVRGWVRRAALGMCTAISLDVCFSSCAGGWVCSLVQPESMQCWTAAERAVEDLGWPQGFHALKGIPWKTCFAVLLGSWAAGCCRLLPACLAPPRSPVGSPPTPHRPSRLRLQPALPACPPCQRSSQPALEGAPPSLKPPPPTPPTRRRRPLRLRLGWSTRRAAGGRCRRWPGRTRSAPPPAAQVRPSAAAARPGTGHLALMCWVPGGVLVGVCVPPHTRRRGRPAVVVLPCAAAAAPPRCPLPPPLHPLPCLCCRFHVGLAAAAAGQHVALGLCRGGVATQRPGAPGDECSGHEVHWCGFVRAVWRVCAASWLLHHNCGHPPAI